MTPLEYLATNPTLEDTRNHWLVFSTADKDSMLTKQAQIPSVHRIAPVELTDGRWTVCCDLLTEVSGGVFTEVFQTLDIGKLNTAELLTTAEVMPLFPTPEEI